MYMERRTHKRTGKKHTLSKRAKPTIIMGLIYANWCGHCKTTEPEWEIMEKMLKSYSKIKCIKIEENEMNTQLPKINIAYLGESGDFVVSNGYPTIFRIEDEKVKYYNGERTAVKMFNWATQINKHDGEGEPASSSSSSSYVYRRKTRKRSHTSLSRRRRSSTSS